jgi:hypothetical protein
MPTSTPGHLLYQLASVNGDGTGLTDMNYDASLGVDFRVTPPVGVKYNLARILVNIVDTRTGWSPVKYGSTVASPGLATGIGISKDNADGVLYYCTPILIKTNANWSLMCYDAQLLDFGTDDYVLPIRWTFERAGKPLTVDGNKGEFLNIHFADDFTGITSQQFHVQGNVAV